MSILKILSEGLSKSIEQEHFQPLLLSCIQAFAEKGVQVDRMQIPMTKVAGLRHPIFAIILMTYKDGEVNIIFRTHEEFDIDHKSNHLKKTPYSEVLNSEPNIYRVSLQSSNLPYNLLVELKSEGFSDYACCNMKLPHREQQLFSIVTRNPSGFPENIEAILSEFLLPFSICLFGVYQSSVTKTLATTYLGDKTGRNVLAGSIHRGTQNTIDAGIVFCDVRGFTVVKFS